MFVNIIILYTFAKMLASSLNVQHHVDISTYTYERTMVMEQRTAMLRADRGGHAQTVRSVIFYFQILLYFDRLSNQLFCYSLCE